MKTPSHPTPTDAGTKEPQATVSLCRMPKQRTGPSHSIWRMLSTSRRLGDIYASLAQRGKRTTVGLGQRQGREIARTVTKLGLPLQLVQLPVDVADDCFHTRDRHVLQRVHAAVCHLSQFRQEDKTDEEVARRIKQIRRRRREMAPR